MKSLKKLKKLNILQCVLIVFIIIILVCLFRESYKYPLREGFDPTCPNLNDIERIRLTCDKDNKSIVLKIVYFKN